MTKDKKKKKILFKSNFFRLDKIDISGKSCSFLTTNHMPGKTNTKLIKIKNNLRFEGIEFNISIGSASELEISVGKKGISGNWPIKLKSIRIKDPKT